MRYMGLDLGTKSLGISLTDKTKTIVSPHSLLRFKSEDYNYVIPKIKEMIKELEIEKIILGLPINMDGSHGYATERSKNFKKILEENISIPIILEDERLTTIMADNILSETNNDGYMKKNKIDAVSASIILETYLKKEKSND